VSVTTRPPRRGDTTRSFCRTEGGETTFSYSGSENHATPRVDYWSCKPCGYTRMQMADLPDAMGLVYTTVSKVLRRNGSVSYGDVRSIDRDDLVDETRELLWSLYLKWNPTLSPRFTPYATYYLPLRLVRWWRRNLGTDGNKPLGSAVSLDADPSSNGSSGGAGVAVGSWCGDPADGDGLVVRQLVARVHRRAARLAAGNGGGAGA
jgi:hypothetical protein